MNIGAISFRITASANNPQTTQSWGSGCSPWGPEKDDQFQKPTHYDGMLEVIGIKGIVHLGQIAGGLSGALRLAQGGRVITNIYKCLEVFYFPSSG